MSATHDPGESSQPPGAVAPGAAERARRRLQDEIERVRIGVEQMLADRRGEEDPGLQSLFYAMREETRRYVEQRVQEGEGRLNERLGALDSRAGELERRLSRVEEERRYAEWRIHTSTEALLDGLLREIRAIGDLLARIPRVTP